MTITSDLGAPTVARRILPPLPTRLVGSVLGGSLSALLSVAATNVGLTGEFGSRGNTIDGFPFDALVITLGTIVGALLGFATSPRVVATQRPVAWTIGLALLAPPIGGLLVGLLTGGGQLLLAPVASFGVALPTTIAVSVLGVLLLRRVGDASPLAVIAACVALLAASAVVAAGPFATTLATFGVGPGVPGPVPTLAVSPPVSRDRAISVAQPLAAELSGMPPVLVSADAYHIVDLCQDFAGTPSTACEFRGDGWAVVFGITDPDGIDRTVLVMIDAVSGDWLYTEQ